jgi:hypothetical protein
MKFLADENVESTISWSSAKPVFGFGRWRVEKKEIGGKETEQEAIEQ